MAIQSGSGDSRRKSVSRRDFLAAGGMGVVGLSLAERSASRQSACRCRSVILVMMNGGASQLETFDPKPELPVSLRSPVGAISTDIPSVHIGEGFPRLAERASQLCIMRSLFHEAAPIHETGMQILNAGRLNGRSATAPSIGSLVNLVFGMSTATPPAITLGGRSHQTGLKIDRGDRHGGLGMEFEPPLVDIDGSLIVAPDCLDVELANTTRPALDSFVQSPGDDDTPAPTDQSPEGNYEPVEESSDVATTERDDSTSNSHSNNSERGDRGGGELCRIPFLSPFENEDGSVQDRYGDSRAGRLLWQAARAVEQDTRFVTVNTFDRLEGEATWDAHAHSEQSPATLYDYRDSIGPQFDRAFAGLLDDLTESGLIDETLVVAVGEFWTCPATEPARRARPLDAVLVGNPRRGRSACRKRRWKNRCAWRRNRRSADLCFPSFRSPVFGSESGFRLVVRTLRPTSWTNHHLRPGQRRWVSHACTESR